MSYWGKSMTKSENHQNSIIRKMYAEHHLKKALELLADTTMIVLQYQSEVDFYKKELFLAGERN